jgi:hypothetical protein
MNGTVPRSLAMFSSALFQEARPDFFRVLSSAAAPLYVDALEAIEREIAQRSGGIERDEAIRLVERVVDVHGDMPLDEPTGTGPPQTVRERARAVVEHLIRSGWLSEEQKSDWRRFVFFVRVPRDHERADRPIVNAKIGAS